MQHSLLLVLQTVSKIPLYNLILMSFQNSRVQFDTGVILLYFHFSGMMPSFAEARESNGALTNNRTYKTTADQRAKNQAAVRAYWQRLKQDPVRERRQKDRIKVWARSYRKRPKTEEQKARLRMLQRQRQRRYQ